MTDVGSILDRLPPAGTLRRFREGLAAARRQHDATRRFALSFPDDPAHPLSRHRYPGAMRFFAAGASYLERAILGGNRSGKSTTVAYELVAHLTGRYPPWWQGRRFARPVACWACGDDAKSTREASQATLLGDPGAPGTGMLPPDAIVSTTRRQGVAEAVDTVLVNHVSGGKSRLTFKSYDMGREAFQGARIDAIWCDEEPPAPVYSEALMRLTSTVPGEPSGVMMAAFTPLRGLSEVVLRFLPGGKPVEGHPRFSVIVGWEDVPHMSADEKARLEAALAPHERDARMRGIPSLGSGAIYPVAETEIICQPFEIPAWYRRCYGLDVGWNRTAAVWAAYDYERDIVFLDSEHYQGADKPVVHAQGIKARGSWIPGVIDPASRGRGQHDGEQLFKTYQQLGLNLTVADNAVESGLYAVWERLSTGRLKVFSTLEHWLGEFRIYRRDDKGRVVKDNDHLMDATRYVVMSGLPIASSKPFALLRDNELPAGLRAAGVRAPTSHQYEYDALPLFNDQRERPMSEYGAMMNDRIRKGP